MGRLAEFAKEYFGNSTEEQLTRDWNELKAYNTQGPDILEVISGCVNEMMTSYDGVFIPVGFVPCYTDSQLYLSA